MKAAARPRRGGPAPRLDPERPRLAAAGVAALALGAALLLLAPPASNLFWAVNGFRSLALPMMGALLVVAAVAAAVAAFEIKGAPAYGALALLLALVVAFPLRERIHFLGDSQFRLRALSAAGMRGVDTARMHANPLDAALTVSGALLIHDFGVPLTRSVSIVGFALALVYFAGWWKISRRLEAAPGQRVALALAMALTGTLQAFAGYAEVAGVIAAAAVWWWAELLAPLRRSRQAVGMTLAFVVLLLGHRVALAMIVPQIWRALGPPAPGDRPAARRMLLGLTALALIVAVLVALPRGLFSQLAQDAGELMRTAASGHLRPSDSLNGLPLVAPLALLAPALAGRAALGTWIRSPASLWVAAASVPLLVMLFWLFPAGESGLGMHRDWDANVLLGIALTVGAGMLIARLSPARQKLSLTALLPLLAIASLGWVAVNADVGAATARAVALERQGPALPAAQRAHLHLYFGQRGMDERNPAVAAEHYQKAFELGGNARRALLATEAWILSGNLAAARRSLALARARGPLNAELVAGAERMDELLEQATADSAARDGR